ncbi:hypothetical protein [Flagellimonas flava]|uniref:hypothetical protein n=1 Tax=Flagellimonas flava TaxID=570519 RepID=UPI003D6607C8
MKNEDKLPTVDPILGLAKDKAGIIEVTGFIESSDEKTTSFVMSRRSLWRMKIDTKEIVHFREGENQTDPCTLYIREKCKVNCEARVKQEFMIGELADAVTDTMASAGGEESTKDCGCNQGAKAKKIDELDLGDPEYIRCSSPCWRQYINCAFGNNPNKWMCSYMLWLCLEMCENPIKFPSPKRITI